MYEVPVKIYNLSRTIKRVYIKHPRGLFKVDTDKKNKQSLIAPGMHMELLVIFETDQPILEDQFSEVIITSENNFKLIIPLKAYIPQPLVQFEPLINLGFVPVGTKKIDFINFINDGAQATKIELSFDSKNDELYLDKDYLELPSYDKKISEEKRKQIVTVIFEPKQTTNLHEKIEVKQISADKKKDLGFIEIIATSVVQQMSIVFEEGGGPHTDINFGLLYHGQRKECCAFLVNNGPKEMIFKFNFHPDKSRKDFNENFDDEDFANTPEEAGIEMTQRILSAEPITGVIKPYSQIPIKFLCSTKIKKEEKGWKVTLCPEYDKINKKNKKNLRDKLSIPEHYQSLAAVKFEEESTNKLSIIENEEDFCKPISVFMEVKAIYPDITVDKMELNFWECKVKEKKLIQIVVTNKNDELPVDFCFNKIPHFTVEPSYGSIKPSLGQNLGQITINVYFHPENIGKFSDILTLKYINNMYEIPIKIYGICSGKRKVSNSLQRIKSSSQIINNNRYLNFCFKKNISDFSDAQLVPDELALDFTKRPFIRNEQSTKLQKFYKKQLNEIIEKSNQNINIKGSIDKEFSHKNELIKKFQENFKIFEKISNKKSLANLELVKMRRERKLLKPMKIKNIDNRNRSVEDLMELRGNRLESPKLRLPEPKDKLWVVKPIGEYEPIYMEESIKQSIGKTPDDMPEEKKDNIKNLLNKFRKNKIIEDSNTKDIPRTHQEIRECSLELSGEELQKIQVGTKELNFGQIFKGSQISKTFWIKNNLRTHIFVHFDIDNNFPDLQRSYPKSQVISPGEMQGFKITVFSNIIRNNIYPVKYIINYIHSFKLKVCADIIMTKLEIQNSLNKFVFKYDKLDKDKIDMNVVQKIRLFNGGNAPAEIKFDENKEKAFQISPMKEIILPNNEKQINVIFNPFESPIQKEKYIEQLKMNIINGEPVIFPVEGNIPLCHAVFYNLENETIIFELVHTGVPTSKIFYIKNETYRVISTYLIQNPLPECLEFKEIAGYLTDKPKSIEVIFTYSTPNPNFTAEVPILIRGGKKLLLKIKANIVQPEVIIEEDKFNFGGVCFNEPKVELLTFTNKSKLPANVFVDLNSDLRYRDFKLILNEKYKSKNILIKQEENKKDELEEGEEENEEISENDNQSEEGDINKEDIREFTVTIPPQESICFDFIFYPNSFDNENLDFYTNFKLIGATQEYAGLRREVIAQKIESIITISEMVVKFPKTFIYENEKNYKTKEIKIASAQRKKSLRWYFVTSDEFKEEGIFDIVDKEGIIPQDQDIFANIKFTFTPREKKQYKTQVTLVVKDSDGKEINKTIRLEGEGLLPRIYFDKRELILPIVPLGIESSIRFKVKNEGYENEQIKAEFEVYAQGVLPVKFYFLENNNIIGFSKNELKCEIKMLSNRPITFTTRLIFYDSEGRQYPIMVAGTADNCIFTNYSFFQRTEKNFYELIYDKETKNVNIKKNINKEDEKNNDNTEEKKSDVISSSYAGSSGGKNSIALLGYRKINSQLIEQNCKYIKKYLKKIHLDDQFKQNNSFKVFPDDVVKTNGKVIYILIKNLIGKEPPGKIINLEQDLNLRALQLREQYCQLIRFLQECGASLNTVFPEYLLDFNLYKKYISLDQTRAGILDSKWDKSKNLPLQWKYYHKESWVLLVYQILKIFYLARINLKSLSLAIKHLPNDIQQKYSSNKIPFSNIYSTPEFILLRWLNACFEYINPHIQREAYSFSKDFSDSSLLTSLILSYFPKEDKIVVNKRKQMHKDVKILNYHQLLNILREYGIYTHVKNFQLSPNNMNAREILLFLAMLYQNLQHFYPRDTIQFSCILGDSVIKAITLMNPTNKVLEYSVKYEGSECFTIQQGTNDIKIEPGKEIEYQIIFKSKVSSKVDGKIYFINRRLGWSNQAAPIVYYLISNVTGRRSIDYKIISTNLYSRFAYKLQVKLPFPKEKGEFEVRLEQKKKYIQSMKKGAKINRNFNSELIYKAFSIKGEEDGKGIIKFSNAEGTSEIVIYFLPVELETYECNVIFTKEKVGEFQYTIEGRVERPVPKKYETFEDICSVEEVREFYLCIDIENYYLKNAVDQLSPIENTTINGKMITNKTLVQKLIPEKYYFTVECSKAYFSLPSNIFPGSTAEPPLELKKFPLALHPNPQSQPSTQNQKNYMWLKVKFTSKNCMVYEGEINIKNIEKPNDIRIYKLYIDVKPKDIKATLEFFCPMNETIEQKIPIENKSDIDWVIKTELTGDTTGYFKVENEKKIPKHNINNIILSFNPKEKKIVNGLLKLYNGYTGEKYFYTLIGNVEEPLANGNIDILNINAKEMQTKIIQITNELDKDVTYSVETDLDEVISGENKFVLKAKEVYNYEMKVKPLLGKIYFGRIIFRDDHNSYKWYTVRIEAKSQIQPKLIEMKTTIRKGVFIELNLENPTKENTLFRIDFDSNLFLFGDHDVNVEANSSKIYKLLFAPLKVGIWDNVLLHVYNNRVGEFLYKLKLICEECPLIISDIIKAELGKYIDYPIMLENPTQEEVEVKYTNSRMKQFQVLQEKIYIPPGIKKEILIRYTPSSLDIEEECQLKFETKKIGKWEFLLRGLGIPPTEMDLTYVRTFVGGVTSGQITFKNPLNEKLIVTVELKCEEFPESFSLFGKKNKYHLEPLGLLIIPFTFKPLILTKYSANLIIYMNKTIFWKYPIEGITEIKSKGIDFYFKTKSKILFETKIFLDLSNLPEKIIDYNDFGYILNIHEEKYKSLINKCLSINFDEKEIKEKNNQNDKKLPLDIKFYPLRPFKTNIEFVLRKKSGGQWIYNIILESNEPDPEDIIHIKAALGKESYVAFKLQNVFTKDAKFIAYFSHDSSSEFSVSPKEGILEQSGREGTQFIICYLPIEYGKIKIAKLIIETDEVEWIFEVRGTHLDYKPPEIKRGNFYKYINGEK